MANFARLLLGIAMLPACWGFFRSFIDAVLYASGTESAFSVEAMSLLGGIAAFALCWSTISHPIRTYVFGHELTHALWGLVFGAVPSNIKVGASGGSVQRPGWSGGSAFAPQLGQKLPSNSVPQVPHRCRNSLPQFSQKTLRSGFSAPQFLQIFMFFSSVH